MPVELGHFRKNPELSLLTREEAKAANLEKELWLQDVVALALEDRRSQGRAFVSLKELRSDMTVLIPEGLSSSYVVNDTEMRVYLVESGFELPNAAVVFLNLMAQSIPGLFLGTLMVTYTAETELEWD